MYERIIKNAGQTEAAILEGEFVFAVSGSEYRVDSTVIGRQNKYESFTQSAPL